jgi:hypothetical protein
VATLTSEQFEMLGWMIGCGPGRYLLVRTLASPDTLVGPQSQNRDVDGADVREIVALGLLRESGENGYEVTNDGRAVYEQLTSPPPERPEFGFRKQPSS